MKARERKERKAKGQEGRGRERKVKGVYSCYLRAQRAEQFCNAGMGHLFSLVSRSSEMRFGNESGINFER